MLFIYFAGAACLRHSRPTMVSVVRAVCTKSCSVLLFMACISLIGDMFLVCAASACGLVGGLVFRFGNSTFYCAAGTLEYRAAILGFFSVSSLKGVGLTAFLVPETLTARAVLFLTGFGSWQTDLQEHMCCSVTLDCLL